MLSSTLNGTQYAYTTTNYIGQTVDTYGAASDGDLGIVIIDSLPHAPAYANALEIVFFHTGNGTGDRDHLINQSAAQTIFAGINDFVGATYDASVDLVDQNKIVERWKSRVNFDWKRYQRDLTDGGSWDVNYDGTIVLKETKRTLTAGTAPASLTDRYTASIVFSWNGESATPMTVFANLVTTAIETAERQNDATLSLVWG